MNIKSFEVLLLRWFHDGTITDPSGQIHPGDGGDADTARALNAVFLITLAGPGHPLFWEADVVFEHIIRTEKGSALGRFYQRGRSAIWRELAAMEAEEEQLADAVMAPDRAPVTAAHLAPAFEAAAMFAAGRSQEALDLLRQAAADAGAPTGSP